MNDDEAHEEQHTQAVVAVQSTLFNVIFSSLAGYAFARLRFSGKRQDLHVFSGGDDGTVCYHIDSAVSSVQGFGIL